MKIRLWSVALAAAFVVLAVSAACAPGTAGEGRTSVLAFAEGMQEGYINWYGRTLHEGGAVIADNAASGFEVTFYGTSLQMDYRSEAYDNAANQLGWLEDGYLSVLADGADPADEETFVRMPLAETAQALILAADLEEGRHTFRVFKATEGLCTSWEVVGLRTDGYFLAPPDRPEYKIEVIGDSILAGNGAQRDIGEAERGSTAQENALRSYGCTAARLLGAEVNVFAVSGGCVGRYPQIAGANVLPELYGRAFPNRPDERRYFWDFTRCIPDAVIVDLGTNDLLAGLSGGMSEEDLLSSLQEQYRAFLGTLRDRYPDAAIFVCCGVYNHQDPTRPIQIGAYNHVFAAIASGLDNVWCYAFENCRSGHPDGEEHAAYAAELAEYMQTVLSWPV